MLIVGCDYHPRWQQVAWFALTRFFPAKAPKKGEVMQAILNSRANADQAMTMNKELP